LIGGEKLKKDKHLSFNANFEDIREHDSQFLKVKMKVFAFGENRNNSDISEEAFELAKQTIFNIPVVAKYTDDMDKDGADGDLEGHNPYLTTDKSGNLTIKNDTYPIGVISSDANVSYEEVNEGTEDSPDMKTYVVVDNVYLWKRYEATQKIQEWMSQGIEPKVSMEIGEVKGSYSKESGCYKINSFIFEAVAALGSNVTPCFPMAQLEQYSTSTFEESFFEMLKELQFSINNGQHLASNVAPDSQEGGNKVPDNIASLLEKYSLTEEQLVEKEIVYSEFSIEELEEKIKESFEQTQPIEPHPADPVAANSFSLTSEQLEGELRKWLACIETITEVYCGEVYTSPRYYYVDDKRDEKVVIARDDKDWSLVGFTYSENGDAIEIDVESKQRYKVDYQPMQLAEGDMQYSVNVIADTISSAKSEFMVTAKEKEVSTKFETEKEELQGQLTKLQESYSELEGKATLFEAQLNEKLQSERQSAENDVFEQFSLELTDDEMKPVRDISSTLSIDDITEKLFALAGKKKVKFNFSKQDRPLGYQIPADNSKSSGKAYDELFEKYKKSDE
jgi:hypothetical protein